MIKEIFDIEPVQKNSLLIILGIFFLSFLQLYLFKNNVLENDTFIIIGLCMALTVCWSVLNFMPLFLFFNAVNNKNKVKDKNNIILDRAVLTLGLLAIGWITLLTYISYELNICFKDFIRLSILVSGVRALVWFIINLTISQKSA